MPSLFNLEGIPQNQQPMFFEKIVAESFSHFLDLPFYTISSDDTSKRYKVVWYGKVDSNNNPINKAPVGPDVIAYCCDFYLIIEATMNTGVNQWKREFASSIRHCQDFIRTNQVEPSEVYIVLVTPQIHPDTYISVRSNPSQDYHFVFLETSVFEKIYETSKLVFTMRHLDIRILLNYISDCIKKSDSLINFQSNIREIVAGWRKEVLKVEKNTIIGIKSYKIMRKINRTHIGTSEIFQELQKCSTIKEYLKIIETPLSFNIIEESLIQQSLGVQIGLTPDDEKLFCPVPFSDFKKRELKLIEKVESISG